MDPNLAQPKLPGAPGTKGSPATVFPEDRLEVLFRAKDASFVFQWSSQRVPFIKGVLLISTTHYALDWSVEALRFPERNQSTVSLSCGNASRFIRDLLKGSPVPDGNLELILGGHGSHEALRLVPPAGVNAPGLLIGLFETYVAMALLALDLGFVHEECREVVGPAFHWLLAQPSSVPGCSTPLITWGMSLRITINQGLGYIDFEYSTAGDLVARGTLRCTGPNQLTWSLETGGRTQTAVSDAQDQSIARNLLAWGLQFPCPPASVQACFVEAKGRTLVKTRTVTFSDEERPWGWLLEEIEEMLDKVGAELSEEEDVFGSCTLTRSFLESEERRFRRQEERQVVDRARRERILEEKAETRLRREREEEERKQAAQFEAKRHKTPEAEHKAAPIEPLPPIPLRIEQPAIELQPTMLAQPELARFFLQEQAALWWVSNQTDDLLCLPFCRIQHLEYQIRTALRAMGPLRGRALLSDEVGLGKTIEAGLILKELLTRGMVERFLVLTVPSVVDQWQEELAEKFGLETRTTNETGVRNDPGLFWSENRGIVASLHTLKQPAHLEWASQTNWDILIVDEAHYLRNRDSQAWQAVNVLPRRFLLLLTATPVQNSLEDLYNLITLLQPGQLPSPKEFRARFIDPKRPRQPREPEELRRLLGQVMIRTTRANSGLKLPPRRAETVLFEAEPGEAQFWEKWEAEFRDALTRMPASQASLWGRLLLQSAGSSPAAFLEAVSKFPDASARQGWQTTAPLEASWKRKCELIPPLTKVDGGTVIFTQYLKTQSALAEELRAAGVSVLLMHGGTPAPERQPIVEEFRKTGGALLLTHSGTEGRNLQFSHRLVNFDLPWNPMEIEQRIGRLHRLGQQQPVRIYNFVQKGTLQEHLLELLQEKLNLFELVVGETGLILGERYSTDEFAEEVLRRWRESDGRVAEALAELGNELVAARSQYDEVKALDSTLFKRDFESA